jgi:hypothetical protein
VATPLIALLLPPPSNSLGAAVSSCFKLISGSLRNVPEYSGISLYRIISHFTPITTL